MKNILFLIIILYFTLDCFAGLSASSLTKAKNILPGKYYNLNKICDFPIFIKNTDQINKVQIKIQAVHLQIPDDEPLISPGYLPLPTTTWVQISVDTMTLNADEMKFIDGTIYIPKSNDNLKKNYQFHIGFYSIYNATTGISTVAINPGVESIILIETGEKFYELDLVKIIGTDGGIIEDPNIFSLDIPKGALKDAKEIKIKELFGDKIPKRGKFTGTQNPIVAFEILPSGLVFNKPLTLKIYYPDLDNNGQVDGTNYFEEELKMYYWDGVDWQFVSNRIDKNKNFVSSEISHFSIYALFPSAPQLTVEMYKPLQKIITPNKDNINDFIIFPGLQGDYHIQIYDITGMKVRNIINFNSWNGTDEGSNIVESGPYIYQYKIKIDDKEKTITGVVVVAK